MVLRVGVVKGRNGSQGGLQGKEKDIPRIKAAGIQSGGRDSPA